MLVLLSTEIPPRPHLRELALSVAVTAGAVLLLLVVVAIDPATCFRDDMLSQYLGASRAVWLATKQGHLALVTPHSWFGGALAGEYQHGVFSVFAVATHALAWSLGGPLRLTAFILVAVPLAWLATGTFRLARVEGCSVSASACAAALATFNRWTLNWAIAWYPSLSTFAWIPWLLWALRRRGPSRPFLVAVIIYAIVAGGWPFTLGMAVVAIAWAVLPETWRTRTWHSLAAVGVAAILGFTLAAPALAMLIQFGHASERLAAQGMVTEWSVPLRALPNLASPFWRSEWHTFGIHTVRPAPELFALVGICLVASAARLPNACSTFRRDVIPWLVLACLAFSLSLAPGWMPFRWTFRWLPLFHLALAIAAAISLDLISPLWRMLSGDVRAPHGTWLHHPAWIGVVLSLAGLFTAVLSSETSDVMVVSALALVTVFTLWLLIDRLPWLTTRHAAPTIVALATALIVYYACPRDLPAWDFTDELAASPPFDSHRLYLGTYSFTSASDTQRGTALRFGNQPLLADLSFVNGYSPMHPSVVMNRFPLETHGCLSFGDARLFTSVREAVAGTILDDLGIDGLIVTPELGSAAISTLRAHGWSPITTVGSGFVLHKGEAPAPRAWLVDPARPDGRRTPLATPMIRLEESDNEATAYLDGPTDRPALLVFKRPAYPGYRATVVGAPARSGVYLDTLVAVPVPAGTAGPIKIWYWPRALTWGFAIASTALAILIAWGAATWVDRRRHRRQLGIPLDPSLHLS